MTDAQRMADLGAASLRAANEASRQLREGLAAESLRAEHAANHRLRDDFAKAALPALLRIGYPSDLGFDWDAAEIARLAYLHADAMLAERAKK